MASSESARTFWHRAIVEVAFAAACLLLTAWLLHHYAEFHIRSPWTHAPPTIVALSPVAALYLILRLLVGPLVSFAIAVGAAGLLTGVNHTKMAFTGMPISWGDLTTTQNVSIVLAYLKWWQIALGVAAMIGAVAMIVLAMRREQATATWLGRCVAAGLLLAIAPIAFQPYMPDVPWKLNDKIAQFLERHGVFYLPGNWRANVSANGLFFHLVQTSRRPIPAALTERQWAMLDAIPAAPNPQRAAKHVYFILCEACWHDDANFSDAFEPLRRLGFLPMRGISPAYGGGTVNASFEMLTAMPSRGVLTGVVYQEYGLVMAAQSQTVASALKRKGYDTYALHNFLKEFWLRHIVLQKFGFDQFLGIEDMHYDGPGPFPADRILYARALEILKQNPEKRKFFSLETVYSHWPYPFRNDSGEGDYGARLRTAIEDMAAFIESVRAISPDALFVIYGDHKPALTKYFYEKGVLPANMFLRTGETAEDFVFQRVLDQHILGDVPVWIGGGLEDAEALSQVRAVAHRKPLYCISAAFDVLLLGSQNPASRYSLHNICEAYDADYLASAGKMPEWLYSAMLFHPLHGD